MDKLIITIDKVTNCECGALDSMTDALNNTTEYFYDYQGRMTGTKFPDGSWTTNRYDALGRIVVAGDSSGLNTTNYFNNQGLLTAQTNNIYGQVMRMEYDIHDRVVESTDGNGIVLSLKYDELGRVTNRIDAVSTNRFVYTARGLVRSTNGLGKTNWFMYDALGRKTAETNANLEVTKFSYNGAGDLLTLTDGNNEVTTWQYDLYGRVTNKIDALSASILRYKYDAAGQLTNRWRAGAGGTNHTYYTYDPAGNLTHINYPTNSSISLSYDALNRLTTMVDGVGTTAYTYDEVGRLLTDDGPWENDTVSYTYEDGVRKSLALEQLGASAWVQTYGYDDAKRLTSVASPAGIFGYSYVSPRHLLTARITLPNGSYITNSYDGSGRLTETLLKNSGNSTLNRHAYVYNAGHQRTRQTFVDGNYIDYVYDDIGQLISAKGKKSGGTARMHEDFGYKYDAAGNLNQRTITRSFKRSGPMISTSY